MLGPFSYAVLGIALLAAGSGQSAEQTSTTECVWVDILSDVVYPRVHPHLLSVGVFGSGATKHCRFRIHLPPTSFPDQGLSAEAPSGLEMLEHLFRLSNDMAPILDLDLSTAVNMLVNNLEYLLASAGPEPDLPSDMLQSTVQENAKLLTSCFDEFYSGGFPSGQSSGFECQYLESEKDALRVNVEYDLTAYSLYTFR